MIHLKKELWWLSRQICSQIPYVRLEKQIRILLFATDFEVLKSEVNNNTCNLRTGWPGAVLLLKIASKLLKPDYPNYNLIGQTYSEITRRNKGQLENLQQNIPDLKSNQDSLSLSLTGIGLLELLWPGVLSGNALTKDS